MDSKIKSGANLKPYDLQNQDKGHIRSIFGKIKTGLHNAIKRMSDSNRLFKGKSRSVAKGNQQSKHTESKFRSIKVKTRLVSSEKIANATPVQSQRLALFASEPKQKSETRLQHESALKDMKNWNLVIVKDESTEDPIAKFTSKAYKAVNIYYKELDAKERAKIREILLDKKNLQSETISISLGNKLLEIKGKVDKTNPSLYLVSEINFTYQGPKIVSRKSVITSKKDKKHVKEIDKHAKKTETNGAKIFVSKSFVKKLEDLLSERDDFTLNSRQINGIFEKYFKLAGLNKGTGSSHSSKNGITFARQHDTSKQLHLGQVRKELETILNMCVVKETSKKAETKNF